MEEWAKTNPADPNAFRPPRRTVEGGYEELCGKIVETDKHGARIVLGVRRGIVKRGQAKGTKAVDAGYFKVCGCSRMRYLRRAQTLSPVFHITLL